MKSIGVFFATREGHTKKIAEFVAGEIRQRGIGAELRDLAEHPEIDLSGYQAVILAASVHAHEHESEMIEFVKAHLATLEATPAAFLSVTLSEAGVERPSATPEERAQFEAGVNDVLEAFFKETGWRCANPLPVAGALLYSKYGFFKRLIMKSIAKKAGAETDTSRDYEYTDWQALGRFVGEFMNQTYAALHALPVKAGHEEVVRWSESRRRLQF